jgi:hypothetical protein
MNFTIKKVYENYNYGLSFYYYILLIYFSNIFNIYFLEIYTYKNIYLDILYGNIVLYLIIYKIKRN